jgi:hypothetical protein
MMKALGIFLIVCFIYPSLAFADFDPSDIIKIVGKIYGVNLDIKNLNDLQVNRLDSVVKGLTGTHSYGSMIFDQNQYDWGSGANSWQDILAMSLNGSGSGQLGSVIQRLSKEYPIEALHSQNKTENEYYLLQAQTTLASRSSSQLAFDQVAKEEQVMKALQAAIDKSQDSKSAADLNNRLIAEQNNLSIQQAKLLAVLVQQVAVDAQEKANRAKEDAEFFDYR